MGYGDYSAEAHQAMIAGRTAKPLSAVFAETTCHPELDPRGVKLRESKDSAAHPESIGIVLALDVSGSMEDIPHALATRTLPQLMTAALTVMQEQIEALVDRAHRSSALHVTVHVRPRPVSCGCDAQPLAREIA